MDIVMLQDANESINGGATKQDFLKDRRYTVPDPIGQAWIGRGWARAAAPANAAAPAPAAAKGKE